MLRPVHFEIHADDLERAVKFYKTVFGWKADKWEGTPDYWLLTTGDKSEPGINGGLIRRMHPRGATYNSIEVPSVDEYVAKALAAGGKVALAKMPIPGVGYLAYCQDTEGNIFGVFETNENAK